MSRIEGIVPVMLTPLSEDGTIDWAGCEALIEWYLANHVDAIFAVCQSSEMFFLSLEERVALARFTVETVAGRVPVLASGHISGDHDDQVAELTAIAATGIGTLVLVTNRLAPVASAPPAVVDAALAGLLDRLPNGIALGFYECPAPFRRLLTDDQVKRAADSGRFSFLKDVSCDLETVRRRVGLTRHTPLQILNANAAIAWQSLKAGAAGFSGVFANFHPDLYVWLHRHGGEHPGLATRLATHLALAAMAETQGYPVVAKLWHQRLGTFRGIRSRAVTYDIVERHWALGDLLDHIAAGDAGFRAEIAALR